MNKYLIEVPHESEEIACCRAIKILLETGSHFLTNADFGCHDGVHKAWIIVEVGSKQEALQILPAIYRSKATVVQLNKFSLEEINSLLRSHGH